MIFYRPKSLTEFATTLVCWKWNAVQRMNTRKHRQNKNIWTINLEPFFLSSLHFRLFFFSPRRRHHHREFCISENNFLFECVIRCLFSSTVEIFRYYSFSDCRQWHNGKCRLFRSFNKIELWSAKTHARKIFFRNGISVFIVILRCRCHTCDMPNA